MSSSPGSLPPGAGVQYDESHNEVDAAVNDTIPRVLRSRAAVVVLATAVLLVIVVAVDRAASRPDRIRLVQQRERMTDLRDAIMRFQVEEKRAPDSLDEVVGGYAPEELTTFTPDARTNEEAPLAYDAQKGELTTTQPFVVNGIVSREETVTVPVPRLEPEPERDEPEADDADVQRFARRPVAGDGDDIVFEAEDFTSLTYGWEIRRNATASGGCYVIMKEGVGDFESEHKIAADPRVRSGDFYNVSGDRRRIEARLPFELERPGIYHVYARTMAARSKCSNVAYLRVDDSQYTAGHNGSVPFVWLQHLVASVYLRRGAHAISLMAHQDGVKIDQVVLSRQRRLTPRGVGPPVAGKAPRIPASVPALNLSVSTSTIALVDDAMPEVDLYIHNNRAAGSEATVSCRLATSAGDVWNESKALRIRAADEMARLRIRPGFPENLQRREYLLACTLSSGGEEIETRTVAFVRGFDWSVLGPFRYMHAFDRGPVEDAQPKAIYEIGGRSLSWRRFDPRHTDHFGMLDFGLMFTGRTFHATPMATLYAYTEFEAPPGTYLLKAQGDDDVVVWLNGKRAIAITEKGPPIRTARERPLTLRGGRYRLLIRLNQIADQWMAGLRIRAAGDRIADVVGVPFDEQGGRLTKEPASPAGR